MPLQRHKVYRLRRDPMPDLSTIRRDRKLMRECLLQRKPSPSPLQRPKLISIRRICSPYFLTMTYQHLDTIVSGYHMCEAGDRPYENSGSIRQSAAANPSQCRVDYAFSYAQPIELLRSLPARPLARAQPRIESGKSAATETLQIHGSRSAVDDQLGHRLAGRRRVEDTPDAVAGREVGPLDT